MARLDAVFLENCTSFYANLLEPYRNTDYDIERWQVTLKVEGKNKKALVDANLAAHIEVVDDALKAEKESKGRIERRPNGEYFQAKRKTTGEGNGKQWDKPPMKMIDAFNNPFVIPNGVTIGDGSVLSVKIQPFVSPRSPRGGMGSELELVQVVKLEAYTIEEEASGFASHEGKKGDFYKSPETDNEPAFTI
jgi:hypothetical protein